MTPSTAANAARKALRGLRTAQRRRALRAGVVTDPMHEALLRELQPHFVIDVGANGGQFALAALEAAPTSTVISFEPLRAPQQRFARAICDERVELRTCALGAISGSAVMHVSNRDDSSSLLPITELQASFFPGTHGVGSEPVAVSTLDDEIRLVPDRTLLKIDVQGFELEVLRGGPHTLGRVRWVLCEVSFHQLYEGQPRAGQIVALLAEHGLELAQVLHLSTQQHQPIQADLLFERTKARVDS